MTKIRAFIFARGGSKGIKGKNMVSFNGKPLLVNSIEMAKQINGIDEIYLSTDSDEMANLANSYGVCIIKRPAELASDHSPEWLSWQHAITKSIEIHGDFDKFLSLPTTSPLRILSDVNQCLDSLVKGVDIVITATESQRNPWFNMVKVDSSGKTERVLENLNINRRQDAPICYDMTTVAYVARPDFVTKFDSVWDGNVATVVIPPERAIDIDTKLDLDFANFLINRRINEGNRF